MLLCLSEQSLGLYWLTLRSDRLPAQAFSFQLLLFPRPAERAGAGERALNSRRGQPGGRICLARPVIFPSLAPGQSSATWGWAVRDAEPPFTACWAFHAGRSQGRCVCVLRSRVQHPRTTCVHVPGTCMWYPGRKEGRRAGRGAAGENSE